MKTLVRRYFFNDGLPWSSFFKLRQALLFISLILSINLIQAANFTTRNNNTGLWSTDSTWNGGVSPGNNINGNNVFINGNVRSNSSITFSGGSGDLFVYDTLIIHGNLTLGNNNNLSISDNAVLVVYGDVSIGNKADISANSFFVVTGNFSAAGSSQHGSFTSNDQPSNVFIGGTINVPSGFASTGNSVFNCNATIEWDNSGCNYGDFVDIQNSEIFSFISGNCSTPLTYYTGGQPDANPNPAIVGNTINLSANPNPGTSAQLTVRKWIGPQGFTWTSNAANNTTRTNVNVNHSGFYVFSAFNNKGCFIKDSVYVLVNNNSDCGSTFTQGYFSRNNYTGAWESSASWETTDPSISTPPSTSNAGQNVLINGYITINGNYSPTGSSQLICDTLVVTGNLNLVNPTLTVSSTGVLIVLGNIAVTGGSGGTINNLGGRIVVNGQTNLPYNYTYSQSGTGTSGAIYPLGGLNSPQASVTANDHDLTYMQANDPALFSFYSLVACGGGVSGGTITVNDASICAGDHVVFSSSSPLLPETGTSYQWYSSPSGAAGSWSTVSGETDVNYTVGALSTTTWYYRQAQKGVAGCTANSNVIQVVVFARPNTNAINHN